MRQVRGWLSGLSGQPMVPAQLPAGKAAIFCYVHKEAQYK